jgi:nitrite reductase (NADH) small subunit
MSSWVEIGAIEDIPCRGARVVRTPNGNIAVFRTGKDEIFALQDRCPHKGGPLSQGIVHGRRVTCPLHSRILELASGRAVPPDEGCAGVTAVKVEAGKIFLSL